LGTRIQDDSTLTGRYLGKKLIEFTDPAWEKETGETYPGSILELT